MDYLINISVKSNKPNETSDIHNFHFSHLKSAETYSAVFALFSAQCVYFFPKLFPKCSVFIAISAH